MNPVTPACAGGDNYLDKLGIFSYNFPLKKGKESHAPHLDPRTTSRPGRPHPRQ